jgi:hypothetical protein
MLIPLATSRVEGFKEHIIASAAKQPSENPLRFVPATIAMFLACFASLAMTTLLL